METLGRERNIDVAYNDIAQNSRPGRLLGAVGRVAAAITQAQ